MTTEPSIRERLARAHFAKLEEFRRVAEEQPRSWDDDDVVRSAHHDLVDAILAELLEPSQGMIESTMEGKEAFGPPEMLNEAAAKRTRDRYRRAARSNWRNMLQHIQRGGS